MPVRFIHTSDVHLGAKFSYLGDKADSYRNLLKARFSDTINVVIEKEADLLMISGDLFDDPHPSQATVDFVVSELGRLSEKGIRTALIAGNHDLFLDNSVYSNGRLEISDKVKLFTPEGGAWVLEELGMTVYGISNATQKSQVSPLSQMKYELNQDMVNIAMVHGSYVIEGKIKDANFPITKDDVENSGFDYIAMGDWHSYGDYSSEETKCFYPGSPEPLNYKQVKAGNIIIGEIENGKISCEPFAIGKVKIISEKIQLDEESQSERLRELIKQLAGENNIGVFHLAGAIKEDELAEIMQEFKSLYFHLIIKVDDTALNLEQIQKQYKDDPIVSRYLDELSKIAEERTTEKAVYSRAIQLGLQALTKK